MNQRFGKKVIAKDLGIKGGYKPGSRVSRELVAYSNVYWAKKIAGGAGAGLLGKPACLLTSEPVDFKEIKSMGDLSRSGRLMSPEARQGGRNGEIVICANPGGEETWDRALSAHGSPGAPFVVMNNGKFCPFHGYDVLDCVLLAHLFSAYSTSYELGNQRGFEEAYYLKRISKGWVYRQFPGYVRKDSENIDM